MCLEGNRLWPPYAIAIASMGHERLGSPGQWRVNVRLLALGAVITGVLALLVFAEPHQERHRRPDQLLNFRAVGVDVHLAGDGAPGAAQLRAHHVAERRQKDTA